MEACRHLWLLQYSCVHPSSVMENGVPLLNGKEEIVMHTSYMKKSIKAKPNILAENAAKLW